MRRYMTRLHKDSRASGLVYEASVVHWDRRNVFCVWRKQINDACRMTCVQVETQSSDATLELSGSRVTRGGRSGQQANSICFDESPIATLTIR